ncbi:unnamed protein product [Parnassius mnemosyne]|uniref:ISXO2-like transposase domain-containing protein n=1 Tax=Parnassius mnemosyne TaxID=213953 RepID=A0AAV1L0V7_9NEOP
MPEEPTSSTSSAGLSNASEQCVEFAVENGLIPATKECRTHRVPMKVEYGQNKNVGSFVCNKGNCRARSRVARSKDTLFENIKISLARVFYLMYCYAHCWSYEDAIHENPEKDKVSIETVCDWYNYCRETVVFYQIERKEAIGKTGGTGKVVQIYESKFGKRKYNKGRRIEGHWILGLIEDGSEDLRLEVCPENIRSADALVPLINKHVAEDTTVHTDFWRAYDFLGEHGYIHKKVNYSDPDNPFVIPDGTHTQRIESQWRVVNRFFKKYNYNHPENFADIITEYLWRRSVQRNKKDTFMKLIKAIKYVYK